MFRKLVIIAFVLGLAGGALAVTIGNPTAANGWDCSTYITVTASNSVSSEPDNTIDGLGMDAATGLLHSVQWPKMWYAENNDVNATLKYDSSMTAAGPVWIAYEFDVEYYLTSVTIWNFNEFSGMGDGSWQGIEDCTISYSTTGTGGWTDVPTTLTKAPADGWDKNPPNASEYAADDTIAINANAKYVVITAATGAAGTYDPNVTGRYGLSEVRFTADVNFASAPVPYSGETDILTDQILSWVKGDGSDIVKHRVWISTRQDWVNDRDDVNCTNVVRTEPNYDPDLVPGRTYYWAVDELDSGESIVTGGSGNLWNFEVPYCVPGTEPNDIDGNLNGDCFIDFKDFAIMAYNWEIDGLWP